MSSASVRESSDDQSRGVLLIGHGTRDETGTAEFFALGQLLADRLSPLPVEAALLEFQHPTISEAWASLIERGVKHIHTAPLLLFAAGHAKQDIPEIIQQCQANHHEIRFDQCRPLSRHPAIVGLATERARQALSDVSAPISRRAVVMVGRGNRDPCAQADMKVFSEVLSRRIEAAAIFTSFYAMAKPSLPDVLQRVAASGRFDTILVQPHLLFEGRLYRSILGQIDEIAQRFANVQFLHSRYLGPDIQVADAIAGRIGEQLGNANQGKKGGNADLR